MTHYTFTFCDIALELEHVNGGWSSSTPGDPQTFSPDATSPHAPETAPDPTTNDDDDTGDYASSDEPTSGGSDDDDDDSSACESHDGHPADDE